MLPITFVIQTCCWLCCPSLDMMQQQNVLKKPKAEHTIQVSASRMPSREVWSLPYSPAGHIIPLKSLYFITRMECASLFFFFLIVCIWCSGGYRNTFKRIASNSYDPCLSVKWRPTSSGLIIGCSAVWFSQVMLSLLPSLQPFPIAQLHSKIIWNIIAWYYLPI